jgi:tRNA pseudouridine38-40 synthase
LLPSYSLIPPHPDSFIGEKIVEYGKEKGVLETVQERNKDCEGFWEKVDAELVKPILTELPPETRALVMDRIRSSIEVGDDGESLQKSTLEQSDRSPQQDGDIAMANSGRATEEEHKTSEETTGSPEEPSFATRPLTAIDFAIRDIKRAIVAARRQYRISPERLARLQEALNQYVGTHNCHNYTIQKSFKDSSAKRHIKSFEVNPKPIIINDTEWLSLKVHGQSFMMHQIRKMVGMATLLVRCGGDTSLIKETYGPQRIAIPKAPALGLLLECPVFASYNIRATSTFEKEPIDFENYREKIDAFKREFIYDRIFEDEEKEHV